MKLTEFYDDLMPRLPGVDETLVLHETFAAVRQLCEEGFAWHDDYGPLDLKASNPNVYIDPMPDQTVVGYVFLVLYQESGTTVRRALTPLTVVPGTVDDSDQPRYFYMEETGKMVVSPATTAAKSDVLTVSLSLIPTSKDGNYPDIFKTHYRDAVISGACSRLMMMASKPWTNPSQATLHERRFRNHIKRIRTIVKQKYSQSEAGWSFPLFAAQRRFVSRSEYSW